MKRSNRLVIFVGVLLAILAFVGIVIVLNGQTTGRSQEPTTAKVLVAKDAIDIGTAVTPDMVQVKEVPLDGVVGTPYSDPSQVGGQPALVTLPAGARSITKRSAWGPAW